MDPRARLSQRASLGETGSQRSSSTARDSAIPPPAEMLPPLLPTRRSTVEGSSNRVAMPRPLPPPPPSTAHVDTSNKRRSLKERPATSTEDILNGDAAYSQRVPRLELRDPMVRSSSDRRSEGSSHRSVGSVSAAAAATTAATTTTTTTTTPTPTSRPTTASTELIPLDVPLVMATVEDEEEDRARVASSRGSISVRTSSTSVPVTARSADDSTGIFHEPKRATMVGNNRHTLTMTDEELAARLQQQMMTPQAAASRKVLHNGGDDDQIVTAEIVQQEVVERRQAQVALDDEIAHLEAALLSRQLSRDNVLRGNNSSSILRGGGGGDDTDPGDETAEWRRAMLENNKKNKLDYMRPETHKPLFSLLILVVTTAFMMAEIGVNRGVEPFVVNPTIGPKPEVLLEMGAKRGDLILNGDYYRMISPIVLHAGLLHFFFNMLGLYNIGVPMEREFGSGRIGAIYLASGMMGVLFSCLFDPMRTSVGASGAIFGLFGGAWADLIQNWSLYSGSQLRMLIQLLIMTVFNILLGLMPFLDNFAHLGGLLCGIVLGMILLIQQRYYYSGIKKKKRAYQVVLMACSGIVLPVVFIGGYYLFFGVVRTSTWCEFCSYFSCVPMPPNYAPQDRWWNCDACSQGGLQGNVENLANATVLRIDCPNTHAPHNVSFAPGTAVNQNDLLLACQKLCL